MQCELNHAFMAETCQLSCGYCTPAHALVEPAAGDGAAAAAERVAQSATHRALAKLEAGLQKVADLSEADPSAAASFGMRTASAASADALADAAALPPHAEAHAQSPLVTTTTTTTTTTSSPPPPWVSPPLPPSPPPEEKKKEVPAWSDLTDPTLRRKKERAPASSAPVKTAAHDLHHRAAQHGAVQSDVVRSLAAGNHGVPDDAAAAGGGGLISSSSTSGDGGGGGGGSKNGVAIAEEFRRVAAQHAASYAPGHVPKWLENQAGHQLASGVSPSASAPKGFAPRILHSLEASAGGGVVDTGVQPMAPEEKEHDRHRWVMLSLLTLWISVIVLAVARWLRLCSRGGKRRPRRPGEPRSDLLHRF